MGIPVIHGGEDVNDLNFNLNDIVFKSSFKINTKSIDNVELLETLSLFNKLTKPSFEKVLPHSEVNNFSTLDTKSFEEFAYFLEKFENIDDKTYYEKGRVSKYSVSGDAITLFHFLSFISDSNIYLYRDFNVFNENKIIEPTNTQHRKKLLENASVFEIGDKLYDPNFAYNVDYQPIFYYLKKY